MSKFVNSTRKSNKGKGSSSIEKREQLWPNRGSEVTGVYPLDALEDHRLMASIIKLMVCKGPL